MLDQPRQSSRQSGSWGRALPFGAVIAGVVAMAVSLAAGRAERGWADASATAEAGAPVCIAAAAHAGGAGGTNWRTDLEVHSVGPASASFTIQCLMRNQANPSPTTKSYTLAAGQSRRFDDVLMSTFGISSGTAALVATASSGQILVTSRTYNLLGAGNSLGLPSGSTFGQFVPGQEELEAIGPGQQGRLIQLSHTRASTSGFRTNVGLVNATTATITVHAALYRNDGAHLGTVNATLRAKEYTQIDRIFEQVSGTDVADGYAVLTADGGSARFFAYASVVDNRTGDPVFVPAVRVTAGGTPPTPTPTPATGGQVVPGPGGTTVTLPGQTSPGTPVTLTTGNGADLAKAGETLVSTVIRVNVGGEGIAVGDAPFVVTIPVTGPVSDPDSVLLKVQTNVGPVYPVAGIYDPSSKLFTAELQRLWQGWNLGVVTSDTLIAASSSSAEAGAMGWVTPDDWQSCAWLGFFHSPDVPRAFTDDVMSAVERACEHLRGAEFRSPKLWLDPRSSPKARIVHIVRGLGDTDPRTSFSGSSSEDDAAFSLVGYNDDQMHSLGQLYFNYDELNLLAGHGLNFTSGHIAIHELLHAVQYGYDIRDRWWKDGGKWNASLQWLKEGTSTVVGMTYQTNHNGIYGGTVTVRPLEPPYLLDTKLQQTGPPAYRLQDFFAYTAKRYNGGSFLDLRWLFQHVSDQTEGQFGKSDDEYQTLYRRAMDFHYVQSLGLTLPEVYTEFVLDRGYRHTEPALLRSADVSVKKNSLDSSLFGLAGDWTPADGPAFVWLPPLESSVFTVEVPDAMRQAGSFPVTITIEGASLSGDEVRVFVFREKGGVMQPGGELEITDISAPVSVPVNAETETLTVFVVNGSVENHTGELWFSTQSYNAVSFGDTYFTHPCAIEHCAAWCGMKYDDGPVWQGPLTWTGNAFAFTSGVQSLEGSLSLDGSTLSELRYFREGTLYVHWINLPLDEGRSTADVSVFAVHGQAAADHVVVQKRIWCGDDHTDGIDFTTTVRLEVWLSRQ